MTIRRILLALSFTGTLERKEYYHPAGSLLGGSASAAF
jgi:hypothetical protein